MPARVREHLRLSFQLGKTSMAGTNPAMTPSLAAKDPGAS
jgi:hypothetical protein